MWLAAVRDVAIALLAIESLVIGVLLALMLVQIRRLVRLLQDEIGPILHTAGDTVDQVNRTAGFVSQNVVTPIIRVKSYAAGTITTIHSLLSIGRKLGGQRRRPGGVRASPARGPGPVEQRAREEIP